MSSVKVVAVAVPIRRAAAAAGQDWRRPGRGRAAGGMHAAPRSRAAADGRCHYHLCIIYFPYLTIYLIFPPTTFFFPFYNRVLVLRPSSSLLLRTAVGINEG